MSKSKLGEGNGTPLQDSCWENPMDGGANPRDGRAWWAAACGAAQSRTRLKQLSSSSSGSIFSISLHTIAIISQQMHQIQEIVNSFELSVLKLQILLQKIFVLRQQNYFSFLSLSIHYDFM